MSNVTFTVNAAGCRALTFRGREVDRHLEKLAKQVLEVSQELVPQPPTPGPTNRGYAKGPLKASARVEKTAGGGWQVIYRRAYAVYVEMGTRKMVAEPYLRPALLRVMGR